MLVGLRRSRGAAVARVGELREVKPHSSVPSQDAGMSPAQRKACGVFHETHRVLTKE